MLSIKYKIIEFILVYIAIPLSFAFNYSPYIKLSIGLVGFIYVIYVLLKIEHEKFKIAPNLKSIPFWKSTILKFSIIAIITFCFVLQVNNSALFYVLLNNPKLWVFILFVYSFLSVYPQELIYRTFFFKRYATLFGNTKILILINAIIFALAHLLFKSTLVLILTFLGGVLFAITYQKTKSTLLVSIEHALYGCWLFTVGMGEMLGFPT